MNRKYNDVVEHDARTVEPGRAVVYHCGAPRPRAQTCEPFPVAVAIRLIDILDDARARGVIENGECRRLRVAIERRMAGQR